MSIRWKFVAVCILIVFVPIFFLNKYSIEFFDRFTRTALENHMIDHAYIAGHEFVEAADQGPEAVADFQSRLEKYGRELQTRLQIVSTNGIVVADSEHPANRSDLSDRQEIRRALEGHYGARNQLTPDNQYMYYYIALPIKDGEKTLAVAYLSRNTSHIIRAINRMVRSHRFAYAISIAVAAIIAVLVSLMLIHPLRKLTRAARRFARGDQPFKCKVRGRDEIAQLCEAINAMTSEIKRKNSYNRDFLAAAAHELKTPLAAIQAAAEVLENGAWERDEARAKFIGNIQFETRRLNRLVGELRELTRFDARSVRQYSRRVEYNSCMQQILERILPALPEDSPQIEFSPAKRDLHVRIVPDQIEQVLSNLIENAVRYTPADGQIDIDIEKISSDFVQTSVSDTGRGIDPQYLDKVFDRFVTTEPQNSLQAFGTGLGLAIAKSIIENHGGEIRAESRPGEGAKFIFTIPLAAKSGAALPFTHKPKAATQQQRRRSIWRRFNMFVSM